jgi:hypothetical protein
MVRDADHHAGLGFDAGSIKFFRKDVHEFGKALLGLLPLLFRRVRSRSFGRGHALKVLDPGAGCRQLASGTFRQGFETSLEITDA